MPEDAAAKSMVDELGDMVAGFEAKKEEEEIGTGVADEDVSDDKDIGDDDSGDDHGGDDADDDPDASDADDGGEEDDSEDETDELAELKAEIINLRSMIDASKPSPKPEEKQDVSVKSELVDFIGDRDITGIVDSKEGLNKFANELMAKAADMVNKGIEKTLLAVPTLAIRQMSNASKLNKIVSDFYTVNEDLVKYKTVVGAMINKVTSENPEYGIDKVLKEAAGETRKALNLKEKAAGKVKKVNPAFSKQSGKRKSGTKRPTLKGVQKEINDLIE